MFSKAQQFVISSLIKGQLELLPEGRVLKSGRVSPYFFNSGLFNSGDSMMELAVAYASIEADFSVIDVLYGPPYKGTILAPAVAMALWDKRAVKVAWASSRKEVKDHGEGGSILGASLQGKNVLIIDDVITTGTTKHEAVEFVRDKGGTVVGVAIGFDRMEKAEGSELSAVDLFSNQHSVPVYAAATLDDLIAVLSKETDFPDNPPGLLEKIIAYKDEYGVK